ncbi:MAG: DNA adenine methylase, partial [Actinobacteria bacterium]|nr:DNA adenine methylase [Actinomycetota bacterium]
MKKLIKIKNYIKKYNNEVHFRNNKNEPIHRWYPFVEGFSSNFVKSIIDEVDYTPSCCFDPFAGSGTTPLACQQLDIKCYSFEVNPFLFDLMKVKLNKGYDEQKLENIIRRIDQNLQLCKRTWEYPNIETQTLFEREGLKKWIFNKEVAWGIFDILNEIYKLSNKTEGKYKLLLKIALASNLIKISNIFRNGKCLSYKRNWSNNGI